MLQELFSHIKPLYEDRRLLNVSLEVKLYSVRILRQKDCCSIRHQFLERLHKLCDSRASVLRLLSIATCGSRPILSPLSVVANVTYSAQNFLTHGELISARASANRLFGVASNVSG